MGVGAGLRHCVVSSGERKLAPGETLPQGCALSSHPELARLMLTVSLVLSLSRVTVSQICFPASFLETGSYYVALDVLEFPM